MYSNRWGPSTELYHYNHNHDPKNGQFTTSAGARGGGGGSLSKRWDRLPNVRLTRAVRENITEFRENWNKRKRSYAERNEQIRANRNYEKKHKEEEARLSAEKRAQDERDKVLGQGSIKDVQEYAKKHTVTAEEYKKVYERIEMEKKLKDLDLSYTNKQIVDTVTTIASATTKVADIAEKGIKAYNLFADVHNSLKPDAEPWKKVSEKKSEKLDPVKQIVNTGSYEDLKKIAKDRNVDFSDFEHIIKRTGWEKAMAEGAYDPDPSKRAQKTASSQQSKSESSSKSGEKSSSSSTTQTKTASSSSSSSQTKTESTTSAPKQEAPKTSSVNVDQDALKRATKKNGAVDIQKYYKYAAKNARKKGAKHSAIDEEDYLMHYGRKGMKWNEHVFGDLLETAGSLGQNTIKQELIKKNRPLARKRNLTGKGNGVSVKRPGTRPISRRRHVTGQGSGVRRGSSFSSNKPVGSMEYYRKPYSTPTRGTTYSYNTSTGETVVNDGGYSREATERERRRAEQFANSDIFSTSLRSVYGKSYTPEPEEENVHNGGKTGVSYHTDVEPKEPSESNPVVEAGKDLVFGWLNSHSSMGEDTEWHYENGAKRTGKKKDAKHADSYSSELYHYNHNHEPAGSPNGGQFAKSSENNLIRREARDKIAKATAINNRYYKASKKGYKRQLNKIARANANLVGAAYEASEKAKKLSKNKDKASQIKADAYNKSVKDYEKAIAEGRKAIDDIVADANKEGFDVSSIKTSRPYMTGKDVALTILSGGHIIATHNVPLTYYKVKDRRKEPDEKGKRSNALADAKKLDRYDINFLEATQNDNYSKSKMLSEYQKYLDNPEEYMKTH